ncbi:MAG: hypothetical protein JWO36_1583 [Myxococcales bacterium]|nr:hypothetical protein [Myxococcales bacterium]
MVPDLVCPGCRARTGDRLDVRTLDRAGDLLICACGRNYPIVDGVPIVMANPAAFLRAEIATVVERDLPPEVAAALVEDGPDDASYPRFLEHLSIYMDAHWGDRAEPPLASFGIAAIVDRIARLPRVDLAVELGCSVGRIVAELAVTADRVVGMDMQFGAVRRARHLLAGERVGYGRREVGRHYSAASAAAGDRSVPSDRMTLFCGDALDPPLLPAEFDRVVALNILDSVRSPTQLLSVVDGLCAPNGELILSSPYAWQSSVMQEQERLGSVNPATELIAILREGRGLGARYHIEDEAELPWTLRRDARSTVTYRVHYVRARKLTK